MFFSNEAATSPDRAKWELASALASESALRREVVVEGNTHKYRVRHTQRPVISKLLRKCDGPHPLYLSPYSLPCPLQVSISLPEGTLQFGDALTGGRQVSVQLPGSFVRPAGQGEAPRGATHSMHELNHSNKSSLNHSIQKEPMESRKPGRLSRKPQMQRYG